MITAIQIARVCKRIAEEKKAEDPVILNLKGLSELADYFVICHGTSVRQMKAIADTISEEMTAQGVPCLHTELDSDYHWLVLDYIDVIVHIFDEESRHYYRLEKLWGDAKRIK